MDSLGKHHSPKMHTILVVDDSPANREAIRAVLLHSGEEYHVLTAASGQEGCQNAIFSQPDLIIMDWVMPEMSGLEALMMLKEHDSTRDIPVVMLTGLGSAKHVEYALNAGASDYLRIPIDKTELLARVRSTIALQDSYKEIKTQREQLEQQNHELIALNQEKNEFLGIAAHDLKNPLNNISDLARIIEQEAETMPLGEVREFAKLIRESSAKMFELVRNLLDVNAIEQGGIKATPEIFDIVPVVNTVIETYTQRAAAKGISFNFSYDTDEIYTSADKRLSEQVLENLISNAVKYSPHGKNVFVRLKKSHSSFVVGHSADNNSAQQMTNPPMTNDQVINDQVTNKRFVRIEIADEGPGISQDDMKKLFGKFARLTAQPTGGEHSTGLGLSIVKKLIEAMHGNVWCESVLGAGATFIVELPLSTLQTA